jgi:ATP-dependent RNA helicase RhlE
MVLSFSSLGLSATIVQALSEKGYNVPTRIQKELIPNILQGNDIIAGAQTGSGKTAAFTLPILEILQQNFISEQHYPKVLILVPTRELAKQVQGSVDAYGKYLLFKSVSLFGGAKRASQINQLKEGVDIVIATSGRLLELLEKKSINLEAVRYLVFDEADTILDMGFIGEVGQVLQYLPSNKQTILISATLSGAVKQLASKILQKPLLIEIDKMGTSAASVEQVIYPVEEEKKLELLPYLIGSRNYQQVLVFTRKKEIADVVAGELNLSGLKTAVIHGDKSTGERSKALSGFREGKIRVLVSTDIAARGLDIPELKVVINYDIPHVTGDHIHRVGRTGRAGEEGLAITLVSPSEMEALKDVERLLRKPIKKVYLEGYAPEQTTQKEKPLVEEQRRTKGAFGKKMKKTTNVVSGKKRKTTKRDGFKTFESLTSNVKKKPKGRK